MERRLAELRAARVQGRSLLMFDEDGRLLPRYSRRQSAEEQFTPPAPRGPPPSELRMEVVSFLNGTGNGRGYSVTELAEKFDVSRTKMSDTLGSLKRRDRIRNEKRPGHPPTWTWYGWRMTAHV